jgi:hypothetical protein
MMFPYSKRLVPHSRNTLNGIAQRCEAKGELNFLDYSDNRRFSSEPDVVEYNKTLTAKGSRQNLMQSSMTKIVSHYMTLFLVLNHERVRYRNGLESQDNNHG